MNTNLALRPLRRNTIATRELRRRKRLSFRESLIAYFPLYGIVASAFLMVQAIAWMGAEPGNGSAVGTFVVTVLALCAFAGASFIMAVESEFSKRRNQVLFLRALRARSHRDVEATRLPELARKYARYSVWLLREQSDIVVKVVRHEPTRLPLIRWRSATTNKSYDGYSYSKKEISAERLVSPTLERLNDAITRVQVQAEALEENAYQEALKLAKLDALTVAMQPPPASVRTQKKVATMVGDEEPTS